MRVLHSREPDGRAYFQKTHDITWTKLELQRTKMDGKFIKMQYIGAN